MKRILILMVLCFGLFPQIKNKQFTLTTTTASAQNDSEECDEGEEYDYNCEECVLLGAPPCDDEEEIDLCAGEEIFGPLQCVVKYDCNTGQLMEIGRCWPWNPNNGGDEEPNPETDCNGDIGGSAYNDPDCGCIGGNTGIYECPPDEDPEEPEEPYDPVTDCAGIIGGSAYVNTECNTCMGGTTGITVCPPPDPCDTYNYNDNEINPVEISAMALSNGLAYPELFDIAEAARQGTLNTTWNGVVNATIDRDFIGSVAQDLKDIGNLKGVGVLNVAGKVIGVVGAVQSINSAITQFEDIGKVCLRSWLDVSISVGSILIKSNVVGFGVSAGWLILKETF